jgi:hypothetical protein
VALAPWPALPVRVAALGCSDLGDDRLWSLPGQDAQEAGPVEQAEAVDQAGRAVAEYGGSVQAIAGSGVGQGVPGGGGVGAGDPEAIGMVAVAALLGDQLGKAPVMIGGAGGVLMHGAELGGGDVLQTVVGLDGPRVHDLRHTAATLAAAAGATTKELMERMGATPRRRWR